MKKSKIIIGIVVTVIFILIIGIVFVIYTYRNDTTKPECTIHFFETALNNDNINGMLDCIEPSEAKIIRDTISKVENITGQSLESLIDIIPFISFVSSTDLFPSYSIDVVSTNIDDNDTTAIAQINVTPKNLENPTATMLDVYMIKIQDVWYIKYVLPISNTEDI